MKTKNTCLICFGQGGPGEGWTGELGTWEVGPGAIFWVVRVCLECRRGRAATLTKKTQFISEGGVQGRSG